MKKDEKDFNLVNLPSECNDPTISKDDFKLVQADAKIHDQKFETKPTTFFKDCLKRFRKNKSSVVAAFILGFLLLLSVVVPIAFNTSDIHDTSKAHTDIYYLEPKLFKAGTGFWDGTKKMKDIPADSSSENKEDWGPDYNRYPRSAVSNLEIGEEQYTTTPNEYAREGYVQFGYFYDIPDDMKEITFATDFDFINVGIPSKEYVHYYDFEDEENPYKFEHELKVTNFVTFDLAKLQASAEKTKEFPEGYAEAESRLYFTFSEGILDFEIPLTDYKKAHDVGGLDAVIDVKAKFDEFRDTYNTGKAEEEKLTTKIANPRFEIRVKNALNHTNSCTLIRSFEVDANTGDAVLDSKFEKYSFKDGNDVSIRSSIINNINGKEKEDYDRKEQYSGIWRSFSNSKYCKETNYLVRAVLCSFTYDTYEAALGAVDKDIFKVDLDKLNKRDIIKFKINEIKVDGVWVVDENSFSCKILDEEKSPLTAPFTAKDVHIDQSTGLYDYVTCSVYKYKMEPYNLDKMPTFILGTDKSGRDMFIYVFQGLRTSLLLGIITSAICFVFGLIWGSISGYFGGAVDLAMERFTDILSGVPWIVVMTLTIIHLGSTFFTFALALCLTGWIGTSHITRTQFYRFRGREYGLASSTLGASDGRLIAKHILPNAMGTIITGAVLMIPSVIFSEATISYLGLGFKNLSSLGVILSNNQNELVSHPYQLLFPSAVIALVMISFNLFGNGLRDAINPSLKGEDE